MSLMAREVFSADVLLTGLGDDPDSSDVAAQVRFEAHGRSEQPRDLARFLSLTVIAVLRDCRSARRHAEPFLEICSELADALLEWDSAAGKAFSLRDALNEPMLDAEELALMYGSDSEPGEMVVESWLRHSLPRVSSEPVAGHRRHFKAALREPRRAGTFPFVAPSARNVFLEIEGTWGMFEATAQSRDFSATTWPVAATLRRLLDFNQEVFFGDDPIPSRGESVWLDQLVGAVSMAEDPLTAPLPRFHGMDMPGEEAVAKVRLGRWARQSGLDGDGMLREAERRRQAGEPLPWEHSGG